MDQMCRWWLVSRQRARRVRVAVAVEYLLHPTVPAPLAQGVAEALERLGDTIRDDRRLGRADDRVKQRCRGEIRNGEPVTRQVIVLAELSFEAIDCGDDLLPGRVGGAGAGSPVAHGSEGATVRNESASEARVELGRDASRDLVHQLGVSTRLVKRQSAGVRAEFGVEELLELERPAALLGVGRIQRRLREALLQGGDDRRRIGDPAAV